MKSLLVMRHAKSDPSTTKADFDRPLNKRGRRDLLPMARLLRALEPRPSCLLASPAARARETAQELAEALGARLLFDERLYLASSQVLGQVLGEQDNALDSLLVVGHNPGLEEWLALLCGGWFRLPTAGLVALQLPVDRWSQISPGQAQVEWFVVPRLLEELTSQSGR